MSTSQARKPGIRVDGGKRRDLNKQRVAARMANVERDSPTPAQKAARAKVAEKRARAERKAAANGQDGAKITSIKLRVSASAKRTTLQAMRCRPGTFEWRYGRDKQGSLFHAGSQFAQLWERAGATVASSADFLRGTKSGFATGLAEGRAQAMQSLCRLIGRDPKFDNGLGTASTDRLIAYCVLGRTSAEIAKACGVEERVMSGILGLDLKHCAELLRLS